MLLAIILVFIVGYICIACEHPLKVNKAATALFMCVVTWTLFILGVESGLLSSIFTPKEIGGSLLIEHLGDACEILFFLMGAMAIVETIDSSGGFTFVRRLLSTHSKRTLMWKVALLSFILSAILDNMTTSIVMVMLLRGLVADKKERIIFASLVIVAANSGGAFSPIGDITTIMLWIKGNIGTVGVIGQLFLPSLISVVVPTLILQCMVKGETDTLPPAAAQSSVYTHGEQLTILICGVGGLMMVPVFRFLTGLPPFMGILLVLSILWLLSEIFHRGKPEEDSAPLRVVRLLQRIDYSTIFFFLGILMTVGVLQETGVLRAVGIWLDQVSNGNHYAVTGTIGVLSSIVDNVPLVAACMQMYPIAEFGDFAIDGLFWLLLAYCAGVGGSMLIIGSAAGVVVMGLEKITFGWYVKHISWVAFAGYLSGMVVYAIQHTLLQ